MRTARTALLASAIVAVVSVLLSVAATPASAHPIEHCFFGWTEEDGVAVEGSPENPAHICRNEDHRHLWRNIILGTATLIPLYMLLYVLIMTPEALRQEKALRPGRRRLFWQPRRRHWELPQRHLLAHMCSFPPAYVVGYVLAPPLLERAFPPVTNLTVTLYVLACALTTALGARIWRHKRRQGAAAPRRLVSRGLRDVVADWEAEHGAFTEEELARARAELGH